MAKEEPFNRLLAGSDLQFQCKAATAPRYTPITKLPTNKDQKVSEGELPTDVVVEKVNPALIEDLMTKADKAMPKHHALNAINQKKAPLLSTDELPEALKQCTDFTKLDKSSPLYSVVYDIIMKNTALKLQIEKMQTSEGNGYGYTARSLKEQVDKLTKLVDALEEKNQALLEEAVEKDI